MKLVWSPIAIEDFESAIDYIEFDLASPVVARRFYETVLEKTELFASVSGVAMKLYTARGIDTGYMYMICGNWMIFLTVENDHALVVRILYGKSDYMRTLFGDIEEPA